MRRALRHFLSIPKRQQRLHHYSVRHRQDYWESMVISLTSSKHENDLRGDSKIGLKQIWIDP